METIDPIHILLVDDHPFTRQGLRAYLAAQPGFQVVGEAGNGKEGMEKALALNPNVVVMDAAMPVMNGLEATRELRRCAPDVRVLILTAHETQKVGAEVVQAGAWGYVAKSAPPAELTRGIVNLSRGETFFSADVMHAFVKAFGERPANASCPSLSAREREVLTLLAENHSNKDIAAALFISVRTVEKHRERILKKLNLSSVAELIKFAIANELVRLE